MGESQEKAISARLVGKVELAELLGVQKRTVDKWIFTGKIVPDYRTPGGSPRFWWPPLQSVGDLRIDT